MNVSIRVKGEQNDGLNLPAEGILPNQQVVVFVKLSRPVRLGKEGINLTVSNIGLGLLNHSLRLKFTA